MLRCSLFFLFLSISQLSWGQKEFADVIIDAYYDADINGDISPVWFGSDLIASCNEYPANPTACLGDTDNWIAVPQGSYIVIGFVDNLIYNAPNQDDLFIDEIGSASEVAIVEVSTDFGQTFTRLGDIDGGITNAIDFEDYNFYGCVNAIKITGLDRGGCVPGFDVVRVYGLPGANISFSSETVILCDGEDHNGITVEGIYVDTLQSVWGCDSFHTTNVLVGRDKESYVREEICQGQSIDGYSATGLYLDTLQTVFYGCDSVRLLDLTVEEAKFSELDIVLCDGENFENYTEAGSYVDFYDVGDGCDSLRFLDIEVKTSPRTINSQRICPGESYAGKDSTGLYVDRFTAANGCDSLYILSLLVIHPGPYPEEVMLCEGESYAGYSETGIYYDTLTSSVGCDSIRELMLYSEATLFEEIDTLICEGNTVAGYTEDGTFTDQFIATQTGCDSIRTLTLRTTNEFYGSADIHLCPGEEHPKFPAAGTYYDTIPLTEFCDSIITVTVDEERLALPNIFSPNDDGFNDFVKIGNNDPSLQIGTWSIYDRWGNLVHQRNDFMAGDESAYWYGKQDGKAVENGVYVYYLEHVCQGQVFATSGNITVIR